MCKICHSLNINFSILIIIYEHHKIYCIKVKLFTTLKKGLLQTGGEGGGVVLNSKLCECILINLHIDLLGTRFGDFICLKNEKNVQNFLCRKASVKTASNKDIVKGDIHEHDKYKK